MNKCINKEFMREYEKNMTLYTFIVHAHLHIYLCIHTHTNTHLYIYLCNILKAIRIELRDAHSNKVRMKKKCS